MVALTGALALVSGVLGAGASLVTAAPARAAYATGGDGLYPDSIDWFEWGEHGEGLSDQTVTNTHTVAGMELATTCTISGLNGQAEAYRPGTWEGDGLDNLYNIGGTGTSNQLISGISNTNLGTLVSFNFDCQVTLDGVPVPLQGLVIADAEASNSGHSSRPDEYIEATPNSTDSTWRVIDRFRADGCDASTLASVDSSNTLRFTTDGDECSVRMADGDGPMAVGFMEGATGASVALQGRGKSAIALGVVLASDFGDAPESYGEAGALFDRGWQGGEVAVGTTAVSGDDFELGVPGEPALGLGAMVDSEPEHQHTPDATGDDVTDEADEDSVDLPETIHVTPGETYTLEDVDARGDGFVAGWIDWNGNGVFDDGEQSDVVAAGGAVDLTWTVPADTVTSSGDDLSFLRLRIAQDEAGVASATGMSTSGEVEDHAVNIALPGLEIEKTSDATENTRPGDTVTYTVTATNTGDAAFTEDSPAAVFDDLSGVLDDATYNNDAAADQSGEVSYAEPLCPGPVRSVPARA
ncbi:CshA/CshB family fibrillar adhesin-related protein [Ruania alba]|uniref:CshA/CshB family fibrillar adhesin-related protein n=1 Tax=Ruania alba TaxID=648782 RepID=UPI0011133B66|nr:CshA/CshB family fibrillar adhesin-related protein [Ruania alba]